MKKSIFVLPLSLFMVASVNVSYGTPDDMQKAKIEKVDIVKSNVIAYDVDVVNNLTPKAVDYFSLYNSPEGRLLNIYMDLSINDYEYKKATDNIIYYTKRLEYFNFKKRKYIKKYYPSSAQTVNYNHYTIQTKLPHSWKC